MRLRRWLLRLAAVLVLAGIAAYVADRFADAHDELGEETALVSARGAATAADRVRLERIFARTDAELARLRNELAVTRAERAVEDDELTRIYGELTGVNQELTELVTTGQLQVLSLAVTKQCLVGVVEAIERVSVSDPGAIPVLESVRRPCEQASQAAS